MDCRKHNESPRFPRSIPPLVVLLTVPKGSRWPYASNNCNLGQDLAQDTPIPEEWRSSLDSFATVDGTVFPEPPMEEGIAHFCSERS